MKAQPPSPARYPKPREFGGRIIRRVIAHLRASGLKLPLNSHILIACSGGADSVALTRLVARYGRRILGPRGGATLLHVNHHWRDAESDADAQWVERLGAELGLPVVIRDLPPARAVPKGRSLEEWAREERKKVFTQESAARGGATVWTAHHGDDLAETVLWRFCTGALLTHGAGIWSQYGVEVRPFLEIRKEELLEFLREEGQTYRIDATNSDPRFLRARLRQELLPQLEAIFPRASTKMMELGRQLGREQRSARYDTPPGSLVAETRQKTPHRGRISR